MQKQPEKLNKSVYLTIVVGKEIDEVLSHFSSKQKTEIIEHLLLMFDELEEFFKTKNDEIYKRYAKRETELTRKHKSLFNPFIQKAFYKLFDFENVLSEKGYYSAEEFNNLKDQENDLKEEDIRALVYAMKNHLNNTLRFLYFDEEPTTTNQESTLTAALTEEKDEEMTEARQVLAIYYLFKVGFGIDPRGTHSVAEFVPMLHLLTGKRLTKLQNSSIYDKLKQMPNYKKEQYLLSDLRYIRPFFEKMRLQTALDLIDEEINTEINNIDPSKRKDFR